MKVNLGKKSHGESNKTKEYRTWYEMIRRCTNSNRQGANRYIGRGVRVCQRWMESYENFLFDVGRAPTPEHSIDRINNDGNYEPGNVRWATRKEQSINKSTTLFTEYNGKMIPLLTFCDEHGLQYDIAHHWMQKGLTAQEMISRSVQNSGRLKSNSIFTKTHITVIREALANGHSLTKIGKYFKTTKGTIWKIKSGYSWRSV